MEFRTKGYLPMRKSIPRQIDEKSGVPNKERVVWGLKEEIGA